jgi:hypothetical protein
MHLYTPWGLVCHDEGWKLATKFPLTVRQHFFLRAKHL